MLLKLKEAAISINTGVIPLDHSRDATDTWLWTHANAVHDAVCVSVASTGSGSSFVLRATIQATPAPTTTSTLHVTATTTVGGGGPVLTVPAPVTIASSAWHNGKTEVEIPLSGTPLPQAVGFHRLHFEWSLSRQSTSQQVGESEHLLFVVLAPPTVPWSDTPSAEVAVPWPGILSVACEWAAGATGVNAVVAAIAQRVFALGQQVSGAGSLRPVKYAPDGSDYINGHLAEPLWFEWINFLSDLHDTSTTPLGLSCAETASIGVTLANLLGCTTRPLVLRQKDRTTERCQPFQTLQLNVVGIANAFQQFFNFHETPAIVGDLSDLSTARVYEPTFMVAGTSIPATSHAMLDVKLTDYQTQAFVDNHATRRWEVKCADPTRVKRPATQQKVSNCEFAAYLRYKEKITPPAAPVRLPTSLSIKSYFSSHVELFDNYPERDAELPRLLPRRRTYFSRNPSGEVVLQLDLWSDSDPRRIAQALAENLASVDVRPEERLLPAETFASLPHGMLAFFLGRRVLWTLIPGAAIKLESKMEDETNVFDAFRDASPV